MATQHGRLREFHPESDTVKAYLERVALYFSANDVPNAKKVAILLSTIGASTYSLLSDLLAPDPPSGKTFGEISAALCHHYEPKRTTIAERFHFHKRDQTAGESVSDFDAALRKLAIHCNFAANLEDSLRDRFVCGLRHDAMQRRLLSEKELTYKKAMEIYGGREGHRARRPQAARCGTERGDAAQCGGVRQVGRQSAVRCGTVRGDAAECGEMRHCAGRCDTVRGYAELVHQRAAVVGRVRHHAASGGSVRHHAAGVGNVRSREEEV